MQSQASSCNFIKKETLELVFSYEFCQIFKNNSFIEHLHLSSPSDLSSLEMNKVLAKKILGFDFFNQAYW